MSPHGRSAESLAGSVIRLVPGVDTQYLRAVLEPVRENEDGVPWLYFLHGTDGGIPVFRPNTNLAAHERDLRRREVAGRGRQLRRLSIEAGRIGAESDVQLVAVRDRAHGRGGIALERLDRAFRLFHGSSQARPTIATDSGSSLPKQRW